MTYTDSLDEMVLFDLPTVGCAKTLLNLLERTRLAWLHGDDDVTAVGVLLNPTSDDLALLLRSVEAWMKRWRLPAIRFEVDGRTYVLQAAQVSLVETYV